VRVISFSVFGTDRTYSAGAVANAAMCPEFYPGWSCRFYVGRSVDPGDRRELAGLGSVVDMPGPEDWSALFWRFLTVADPTVDLHLFRDADSRPCARESAAVSEWLRSGRRFHIMRDHPKHWIEILAGMWGCTREGAEQVRDLLPDPLWNSQPYVDQWWLRDAVYPVARDSMLVHDSYGHFPGEDHQPFPTPRDPPWQFVAQGYNADGTLRIPGDALAPIWKGNRYAWLTTRSFTSR
jgi:hypothetical protein